MKDSNRNAQKSFLEIYNKGASSSNQGMSSVDERAGDSNIKFNTAFSGFHEQKSETSVVSAYLSEATSFGIFSDKNESVILLSETGSLHENTSNHKYQIDTDRLVSKSEIETIKNNFLHPSAGEGIFKDNNLSILEELPRREGTNLDDFLIGSETGDQFDGGNGDDFIIGNGGADTLRGGNGDDQLEGGAGDDLIFGGNGSDHLIGGPGANILNGGNGNDVLVAGAGGDLLVGGNGADLYLFTKDSLGTGLTSTSLIVDTEDTIDLLNLGLYKAEGDAFTGRAGRCRGCLS